MTVDVAAVIAAMRAAGHEHLIHYAWAAHRDPVAHAMCVEYLADPTASESVLKSRALKSAFPSPVSERTRP